MSDYITRKILSEIRKIKNEQNIVELPKSEMITEQENIFNRFNILMEEAEQNSGENAFVITSKDVQFGSVRASQEDAIRKTVGDVTLKPDALKYYPQIHDLVINGEVSGLGITFQFRYKDPSGDGCYIWAKGLQMTDANLRTVEKIRDAFLNWKQSLIEDGDLLQKLDKQVNKE